MSNEYLHTEPDLDYQGFKILKVNPENKPRDLQAQIQEKDTASRGQQEKPRERQ